MRISQNLHIHDTYSGKSNFWPRLTLNQFIIYCSPPLWNYYTWSYFRHTNQTYSFLRDFGALHYVKSFFVKSGLSHLRQINSIHFRFRRVTCFPKMNSKENMDEKAVHMNAACVRHDGLCKLLSNWRFQACMKQYILVISVLPKG